MWGRVTRHAPMMRFLLGLAVVSSVGGCGFQPLYGTQNAQNVNVSREMQRVFVANIPTRFGQEMRLALQQDMAGADPEHPDGYILRVNGSTSIEAIDIHRDNTSGRTRVVGNANWHLYTVEAVPRLLAQGHAQTLDGFNPTIEQYFAQSLNNESVQQRVAQTLAHSISQQVAIWFRSNVSLGEDHRVKPDQVPDVDSIPTNRGTPFYRLGSDGFPAAATGRQNLGSSTTNTGEDDSQ